MIMIITFIIAANGIICQYMIESDTLFNAPDIKAKAKTSAKLIALADGYGYMG